MIARLARVAGCRPAEAGAVLVLLGVWLTAASVLFATGWLGPVVRRVFEVLAGILS